MTADHISGFLKKKFFNCNAFSWETHPSPTHTMRHFSLSLTLVWFYSKRVDHFEAAWQLQLWFSSNAHIVTNISLPRIGISIKSRRFSMKANSREREIQIHLTEKRININCEITDLLAKGHIRQIFGKSKVSRVKWDELEYANGQDQNENYKYKLLYIICEQIT